jgi:hypothetical protein
MYKTGQDTQDTTAHQPYFHVFVSCARFRLLGDKAPQISIPGVRLKLSINLIGFSWQRKYLVYCPMHGCCSNSD